MEENKIVKYQVGLVQRVNDVIGITNKLLRDLPIYHENDLNDQQEENIKIQARQWKICQLHSHFNFIGENNKHIVVLISEFTEEYIQPTSMKFLLDILRACKLELDDVAIINIAKEKIELTKIIYLFSPKIILSFGIKNTELNSSLDFTLNQIFTFQNCKILGTRALNLISGRSEKRELWFNLKRILNL